MTVSGQDIRQAAFAHDQNRTAIRQRPFFVRMLMIKFQGTIKQIAGGGNYFAGRRLSKMKNELAHAWPAL